MEFSEVLNKLLESRKLTAYRLSKETGISQRLIGYWKKGEKKPSSGNLQKLAEYFHVSTDYLLAGEESKKESPPADKTEEEDDVDINNLNFALSGEVHELSEDEIQEIVSFAKFMRQQRKLRDQKKKQTDGDKKDG